MVAESYTNNFSMLQNMFELQRKFQKRLNNDIYSQQFITEQTLCLIVELVEALQNTPWKSWKKNQEFNKHKFREELIDCWHFLINLSLSAGYNSQELYEAFLEKHRINNERQDNNY
ncbi:MAG: dUTPase [Candidatus Heimdallarchaeaceae archaeon]